MLLVVIMLTSGIIFYWFSWIIWTIVTFFMKKNRRRTAFACWILLAICCSNIFIDIEGFHFSVILLLLIVGSLLMLVKQPRLLYHLFSSFTITIGYVSMLMWEINAPVWIIFSRVITISFLLGIVTLLFSKEFYSQLAICVFGTSIGELLYHFILAGYGLRANAGDFAFLDCLLAAVISLLGLRLLLLARKKLIETIYFKNTFKRPIHRLKI
jgi:hypothetical protein